MTTLLAIVLCVTLAAYTVAGVGDILLSLHINRKLNETITMAKIVNAKAEGLRKRVDALEKVQAQAPRLVSLEPTEGKLARVHTKGGRK